MSGAVPGTLGGPMFGRGRVEQQKTHGAFISAGACWPSLVYCGDRWRRCMSIPFFWSPLES